MNCNGGQTNLEQKEIGYIAIVWIWEKMKYDDKYGNVKWDFVKYFKEGKLQTMSAKDCAYKIKSAGGKPMVGQGRFGYLESKNIKNHIKLKLMILVNILMELQQLLKIITILPKNLILSI